jgi:starch phosphorylase
MNEGHAALLTLALLEAQLGGGPLNRVTEVDVKAVRQKCVFTTHTPVPAGHDRFSMEQSIASSAASAPPPRAPRLLPRKHAQHDLRRAALLPLRQRRSPAARQRLPRNVPRVPDRRHHQRRPRPHLGLRALPGTARQKHPTGAATTSTPQRHRDSPRGDHRRPLPGQGNPARRGRQPHRPGPEPQGSHLGFARRAATYKRADLLFTDPDRLLEIARPPAACRSSTPAKPIPMDEPGKALITASSRKPRKYSGSDLRVVYLENYDWELGALLTAGVDVWVNTPKRPYEASGTSGMKAALNGVPKPLHPRRLVDRRLPRRLHRLGHRRRRRRRTPKPTPSTKSSKSLRSPALSQIPRSLGQPDAHHRRLQRLLLQHQPHGQAIHPQRLLPSINSLVEQYLILKEA